MGLLVTPHMGHVVTPCMGLVATPWPEARRKRGSYEEVVIVVAHIIRCALGAGPARRLEQLRDPLCGIWLNQQPLSSANTA
jgi:hypothetical protein